MPLFARTLPFEFIRATLPLADRVLKQEECAARQTGREEEIAFYGGGVHYAAHRTPLLAPLHTLTAAHSFSYTCFLKPPINNEGCSQPCLGGREKGHYRPGLHLSKLFHNLRSRGGFLLQLIVDRTTEHKFPLAINLLLCRFWPSLLFVVTVTDKCTRDTLRL